MLNALLCIQLSVLADALQGFDAVTSMRAHPHSDLISLVNDEELNNEGRITKLEFLTRVRRLAVIGSFPACT